MGMDSNVVGIKPPDDRWRKMKHIRDACVNAEISIPEEVDNFFEGEKPDATGVIVEIPHRKYNAESCDGFEVDLSEIPADVKIVRFVNSY
jgi:hypothetical protein